MGLKSCPSLNSPAHGYPDDGGERPHFVLIEPSAYFADRDNATTAFCQIVDPELEAGSINIKLTFCAVHPPGVSYMCVNPVGLGDPVFAHPPCILATETDGSLLLLSVPIPIRGDPFPLDAYVRITREEYVVYDARVPSLTHLPHPEPDSAPCLVGGTVAILRKCHHRGDGDHDCSNCSYVVAAQSNWFGCGDEPYQIYLYHSDTSAWSSPPMVIDPPLDVEYQTHKTIAIGGDKGTVGWVDLSSTIIFCDVLDERPTVHYLPLPPPIDDRSDDASTRDVAIIGSSINYVVMEHNAHGWRAAVWSIDICASSFSPEEWRIDYELDSSDLRGGYTNTAPYIGLPKLSMQDDGIVYFLTKVDYRVTCHTAWVLAVDMRRKTVLKVGEFIPTRTFGLYCDYDAISVSKYLKVAPRTC